MFIQLSFWPEQALFIMLNVSWNKGCIDWAHFSKPLPGLYNYWRMRWSEIRRERDGNNQEKTKRKGWLGDDAPVFPQAFSARLLFQDLSLLWHLLLLLPVASCADGLGTVLGLQLWGYQVERGGRRGGQRNKEGRRIQPGTYWVTCSKTDMGDCICIRGTQKVNTFVIFPLRDWRNRTALINPRVWDLSYRFTQILKSLSASG